jgi:hypothetical protein
MIICPNQKFVFVHIPKCAGTSVRSQIVRCDADHISFGRVGRHDVLGTIDYGHIPLDHLRVHFPTEYAAVQQLDSFAIVRDPLARFGSALRQVIWQYEKRPMTLIPPQELREKTLNMLDQVAQEIDEPSHPFIFFARQSRFIFDGDARIVDHLIPLDMVPDFIGYLSRRTGTPMETGVRANQNVDLKVKGRLGQMAYRINGAMRKVLPRGLHDRIKDTALSVLSTKQSAAQASGLLDLAEVKDFVQTHYAQDVKIYHDVMQNRAELKHELTTDNMSSSQGLA